MIFDGQLMDTNKKREIVISKSNDITLASSQLTKRGLEIIAELVPHRIHVPSDYPTIAEAINNAVNDDTIELAEGIYREELLITIPVELVGCEFGKVTLESPNLEPIITYNISNGINKLSNIIFTKASLSGNLVGIKINGGTLEVDNCKFEEFFFNQEALDIMRSKWGWPETVNHDSCTAISFSRGSSRSSKMIFKHCSFVDCGKGIEPRSGSEITLYKCSFISSSINLRTDCRVTSSSCFYLEGSYIDLYEDTILESSYDTFLDVKDVIRSVGLCQTTFSHATIVSRTLLGRRIGTNVTPDRNPKWEQGKPSIHFLNSIVVITSGYHPYIWSGYTGAEEDVDIKNNSLDINLANEGIITYSKNNLLNLPPYFLCQDPLLKIDNNIARLSSNSPAIKSASDGTNIGAWQGE